MLKRRLKDILLMSLTLTVFMTGCKSGNEQNSNEQASTEPVKVQIEMESGGIILLELYPEYAPVTVENFVKLVNEGFYDGLTFHRIVDGFMAQGGDPAGDGTGGGEDIIKADTIKGEFSSNGFTQNTLKHTKGVISMARVGGLPDSASSQFFIMLSDYSALDGDYAAFGKVIEGQEVVDDFQKIERTYNSIGELATPVEPVVIKKASVVES